MKPNTIEIEEAAKKWVSAQYGWGQKEMELCFIAGAKSQAAKECVMQQIIDDIEMNLDDWCRTPLVMATKIQARILF